MSILVLAEHQTGEINPASLATISAAFQLEGEVTVLVLGTASKQAAEQYAQGQGVDKVLYCESILYDEMMAEEVAALLKNIVDRDNYSYVLAGATTLGKNILPRLGSLLDSQPISEIIQVVSADTFVRPIYAGNCMATVQSSDTIKVITVRQTAFDALAQEGGSAPFEAIEAAPAVGLSKFIENKVVKSDRPDLTAAGIVVSGGRGVGSKEDFALIESLADKIGAAAGASRAAVDSGYAPNDWQVGQTGKIVAPNLYIAVGISGAIQHLAGMKDSKVIVAINKDADAPIFAVSDYGLVGDLFKVLPELENLL